MFKVGDRARLVRRGIPTKEECGRRWARDWPKEAGLGIGDICTVTAVNEDGTIKVNYSIYWFDAWYFEKIDGLSGVKYGDWIATIRDGWVQVTSNQCPIEAGGEVYTITGFCSADKAPSAFVDPPEWLLDYIGPRPVDFAPDEVILVSDKRSAEYVPRHFVRMEGDRAVCVRDGRSMKTMLNSHDVCKWIYFKKLED
jgi:hypothetical protein